MKKDQMINLMDNFSRTNSGVSMLLETRQDVIKMVFHFVHRAFEVDRNPHNSHEISITELIHGQDPGTIKYGISVNISPNEFLNLKTTDEWLKLFATPTVTVEKETSENEIIVGYILTCTTDDKTRYFCDEMYGGFYVDKFSSPVTIFKTEKDIQDRLNRSEWTNPSLMSDHSIHPPSMIHKSLDLCNRKLSGHGTLSIVPVKLARATLKIGIEGAVFDANQVFQFLTGNNKSTGDLYNQLMQNKIT